MRLFRKPKARTEGSHQDPGFPVNDGESYLDVIDRLEAKLQPSLYLEIGSRSGTSLARRSCSYIAIDPQFAIRANVFNTATHQFFFQQTSDDFFASQFLERQGWMPELAFIDGMHLFEFVLRDFLNCEARMAPHGAICLHDMAPFNADMTTRDLSYIKRGAAWTGDVWKLLVALADLRPDLKIELLSARKTGLAVISNLAPGNRVLNDDLDDIVQRYQGLDFDAIGGPARYFDRLGHKLPSELSLL